MSKAMKYDDFIAKHGQTAARKLEENNGEQQEFEISSYHSINPQECVNFKVQTDNIYDENVISYAANGEALAEKSYVIFHAYYADGNGDSDISWIAPSATSCRPWSSTSPPSASPTASSARSPSTTATPSRMVSLHVFFRIGLPSPYISLEFILFRSLHFIKINR